MTYKSRISSILKLLNNGLYEREEIIAIILLSALAEQNIFLFGPPGTAKSLISRRLSESLTRVVTKQDLWGKVGNVESFKNSNLCKKFNSELNSTCNECWLSNKCHLACYAENYYENSDGLIPSEKQCMYLKADIEAQIWLVSLLSNDEKNKLFKDIYKMI